MQFDECLLSLGCDSFFDQGLGCDSFFDQGSSFCLLSNALTLNVIGLLFLRQRFILLPASTETSNSGMSRMSTIWILVSQFVGWKMT
jgi:hypothetical protein